MVAPSSVLSKYQADSLTLVSMKSFSRTVSFAAMIIGALVLIGWAYPVEALRNLLLNLELVRVDTGLALITAGAALWLFNRESSGPGTLRLAYVSALVVLIIGLLSISRHVMSPDVGINPIPGAQQGIAGYMSATAALFVLLFGIAVLLLDTEHWLVPAQTAAAVAILVALFNFLQFLVGPAGSSPAGQAHPDLVSTATFIMLSFGVLCSRPSRGVMAIVSSAGISGEIARRLLPLAIGAPFLLFWITLLGQRAGFFGAELGITLTTLASIVLFTLVIWWNSISLSSVELERRQASEAVHAANEKLTGLVRKMEEHGLQNTILSEMRDLLQSCSTVMETPPIIKRAMEQLFPSGEGALFLLSPSRNDLEAVVRWGDFPEDVDNNVFAPDECWALRRGQLYPVEDVTAGVVCAHLKQLPKTGYVCVPLMAKSEVLGLLHLRARQPVGPESGSFADLRETAVLMGDNLSLGLANIRLRETLRIQSIRDLLTGLFNRRYMEETLGREILRAARKKGTLSIIMLDIDHFKQFNDLYGHAAGDELLVHLGNFFKTRTRGGDIPCRYGGEEFILIMPDASTENAGRRADELRTEVKTMKVAHHGQLLPSVTISMGVAVYPTHAETVDDLLRLADAALYRAKQEGRDRVVIA